MTGQNAPTDQFGPCPFCSVEQSRIIWGWHGVYYDMVCMDGHTWTYYFPKMSEEELGKQASAMVVKVVRDIVAQASYEIAGVRKCDLCKGTAHKETCAIGKMEKLLKKLEDIGVVAKEEKS